jgi:membrane-bound lytic murein transglycosylase D
MFFISLPEETINHVKKYLNACYATGELQSVWQIIILQE